jgi:hypothetical protein
VGYANERLHIVRRLSAEHDWKVEPKFMYNDPDPYRMQLFDMTADFMTDIKHTQIEGLDEPLQE